MFLLHSFINFSFLYVMVTSIDVSRLANNGQFPYHLAIKYDNGKVKCGGVIFHENTFLTVPQCFQVGKVVSVTAAVINLEDPEKNYTFRVSEHKQHPKSNLVMAKIDGKFWDDEPTSIITPIKLPTAMQMEKKLLISGFGIKSEPPPAGHFLKKGEIKTATTNECLNALDLKIEDNQMENYFCGLSEYPVQCLLDRGSGMIIYTEHKIYTLLGMAQETSNCTSSTSHYVLYINILKFVDWFQKEKTWFQPPTVFKNIPYIPSGHLTHNENVYNLTLIFFMFRFLVRIIA